MLEGTTASDICERVLSHYLALEEKPPRYELPADVATRQRSIHVRTTTWAAAKAQKVRGGRPVSAILEQLLRAYLGFPFASDPDGTDLSSSCDRHALSHLP